jgi:hypothetical protein
MSGSGSTMLAVLETQTLPKPSAQGLRSSFGTDLWCRLCQTISSAR